MVKQPAQKCPKIAVNVQAPAYVRLAALLDHAEADMVVWKVKGSSSIAASLTRKNSETLKDTFSEEEITTVCAGLYNYIYKNIACWKKDAKFQEKLITLWKHFKEPGVFLDAKSPYEYYLKSFDAIYAFDAEKGTVNASFYCYGVDIENEVITNTTVEKIVNFFFKKELPLTPTIHACRELSNITFKDVPIILLESAWPGFRKRLRLGLDLNLSAEELAQYCSDLGKPGESTPELPLCL